MPISEMLLPEYDNEMKKTRATLERIPSGTGDFSPHAKSMPMGKLAPHVAQLAGFGMSVLTAPGLDFSTASYTPLPFESATQLVGIFDKGTAEVRAALAGVPDSAWKENWKLSFGDNVIFEGSRFLAYREMFINHLIHHRAQLTVYLRLNDIAVPAIYGPSADDRLGF